LKGYYWKGEKGWYWRENQESEDWQGPYSSRIAAHDARAEYYAVISGGGC